jgi:Flp pilus assembly protein TadG
LRALRQGLARRDEGAELLEFALILPFLLVMLMGIIDFGGAWAMKDKLAGAAREGARVAVAEFNDSSNPQCSGTPCSVQAAASAVTAYLSNSGVDTCGFDPASTAPAGGTFTWTYTASSCANPWSITVERAVPVTVNSTNALCTRITLSYPYAWTFGNLVGMLGGSNPFGNTITLNTAEIMTNLN